MRNTATHVNDGAPPLTKGSSSSDDGFSADSDDDTKSEERSRRHRHRHRGGGAPANATGGKGRRRNRGERRGGAGEKIKIFSPVVIVLLIGVLLSLLDVFYIMKHLDESSSTDDVIPTTTSLAEIQSQSVDNSHDEDNTSNNRNNKNKNIDSNNPIAGREEIIKIITDAGISFDPVEDADLIEELPLWSEVTEMYGTKPVLHGFNEGNCQRFQASSDPGEHFLGTAGTFNTGTNLMSELLISNCMMPERMKKYGHTSRGVRWQVPWGKHSPAGDRQYREEHKTLKDKNVDANEIMPMVTIRDPLFWLKSMCRHHYTAMWIGREHLDHCPNFLDKDLTTRVKYDGFIRRYDSLLDLWNAYYTEYINIDIPILLVRFEDLIFHTEEVITKVCECAGGRRSSPTKFRYVVDSAKKGKGSHGKDRTGFVDALVRYGTVAKRYAGYESKEDLSFIQKNVDPTLMRLMQYSPIQVDP